jgi:DNA repair protein RecO (recombination protein O)
MRLTVEGLILRNLRLGETSRVVTVLSRELGKWSAVAKGVREPKSRFGASLEILNLSSLVLYFRPGRNLQMVSEASLEREFRGILRASDRYLHACAVLEFLDAVLEEESPVPEIFDLAVRVLGLMEDAPEGRLSYLLRAFQLRVAGWLGYAPRVDACSRCGSTDAVFFGIHEGSVLCERCGEGSIGAIRIDEGTLSLLRSLQRGSLPRRPGLDACRVLSQIAESFLAYHIDRYRGLRSLRGLAEVGRLQQPAAR